MSATRAAAWLAGVWAGLLAALALIAAPSAFAVADRGIAGGIAAHMFAQEAYAGVAIAVVLFLVLRTGARRAAASGRGSVLSADMLLVLGALFCTVLGWFAVQPMMAAARAGQGSVSFAALHGVSTVLYGVKTLLVAVLAWRLAPP